MTDTQYEAAPGNQIVRLHIPLLGGAVTDGPHSNIALPFVLRKELVEVSPSGDLVRILETAHERVEPRCPHFGTCGGCQYQMIDYQEQVNIKRVLLYEELHKAGVTVPPAFIPAHAAEPYEYRNRIRLRIQRVRTPEGDGPFELGYNIRTTTDFLPITTCPISAPTLWQTAVALLTTINTPDKNDAREAEFWLSASTEVELFANDDLTRIQVTLLCAPRTKVQQGSLARTFNALKLVAPQVTGLSAIASDPRTGPTGRTLDTVGTPGISYKVNGEPYWISRGGFFQVNRFLVGTLVDLVTSHNGQPRSGNIAWDLFAGVGLFSRMLAKNFKQVTAVESNPTASADLRIALTKLGPQHRAVEQTTVDFLASMITQRERPDLIVLDPPRAGAGLEACALLDRIAAPQIVYVSCDPTTLARDLAVLQHTYTIADLHLIDLFPQTFHMETVVILNRRP